MLDSTPSNTATAADADDRSLLDDVRQLADDARAVARAEVAYQKSRAAFAGQEARSIALFGVLAAVLAFFALMALTLGLVIALTPLITAWGATAAVAGGLLVIAMLCGFSAARRWQRMRAALTGDTK